MTNKTKMVIQRVNEKLIQRNRDEQGKMLEYALEHHVEVVRTQDWKKLSVETGIVGLRYHDSGYWDAVINHYTGRDEDLPKEECIPRKEIKGILQSRIEMLVESECVDCLTLAKELYRKYK